MPMYEYECNSCGRINDRYFNLNEFPSYVHCEDCEGDARKIVSSPFVQDDHPRWINQSLRDSIQDEHEKPIENRKELNDKLERDNLVENPKS